MMNFSINNINRPVKTGHIKGYTMKLHIFSKTNEDNKGELLGTIDANQTGLQDWEILQNLGVDPGSLRIDWCGDNSEFLATCEVDAILEIEMEVK